VGQRDAAYFVLRHLAWDVRRLDAFRTPHVCTNIQTKTFMTRITAAQVLSAIATSPSRREFSLRDSLGQLVRTITRHEVEVLAFAMTASRKPFICGQQNKHGLRWIELLVEPRIAAKLLRRMVSQSGSTVAEDCRTIDRRTLPGGGIIYSHRSDFNRIWGRREHWENWGARGARNRAVLVVPR
jgi:hypothetical protein